MEDPLVETWQIHNRINLYLLDAIAEEAMGLTLNGKGRCVRDIFSHLHAVRILWLKASAPELLEGLDKLEPKVEHDKAKLRGALEASGVAVGELIGKAVEAGGKVKGFKPHVTAFLGYLISHESHHRGQIGWLLKHSGHPLDKKTAFGLWEWGVRWGQITLAALIVALLALAPSSRPESILDPSSVSTNMGTLAGCITNVINPLSLSAHYNSLMTDYASYTASTTSSPTGGATWLSASGTTTGNVDFALVGSYSIDSFALWTLAVGGVPTSIQESTLLASDDSSFKTTFGSSTATEPTSNPQHAQDFNFAVTTASYVRLEIMSNYGEMDSGFIEGPSP